MKVSLESELAALWAEVLSQVNFREGHITESEDLKAEFEGTVASPPPVLCVVNLNTKANFHSNFSK